MAAWVPHQGNFDDHRLCFCKRLPGTRQNFKLKTFHVDFQQVNRCDAMLRRDFIERSDLAFKLVGWLRTGIHSYIFLAKPGKTSDRIILGNIKRHHTICRAERAFFQEPMLAGTLAPLFEFTMQLGQRLDEQTAGGRETGAGRMGKIAMIRADINNPPGLIDLQNFNPGYKSIELAPIMKREAGECLWQERTTFQV